MTRTLVGVAALLCGCFDGGSLYRPGFACSPQEECPPEQVCVRTGNDTPTCQYVTDAGHDNCDLLAGTGCGGDYKCTLASQEMPVTVCVPGGNLTEGEACVSLGTYDECAQGLICLYGSCRPVCEPDTAGCGSNTCVSFGSYAVCATTCDPLAPQCPKSGLSSQTCYIDSKGESLCLPTQNPQTTGLACTKPNECTNGASCVDGFCRTHCNFASNGGQQGSCLSGQTCQQVGSNVTVGVCK